MTQPDSVAGASAHSHAHARKPKKGSTLAALSVHNFRYFIAGQIISLTGTWMQRIAQSWLVLILTDSNALAAGIVIALQFAPTLFLSPWAGLAADRYDKRTVIWITQLGMAVGSLILGLIVVLGHAQIWHVYVAALAFGIFSAINAPVRQSFTIEMVGEDLLPNAIALNSMVFNGARIIGPAIAGVMIALWGTGPVFLTNVALTFVIVWALWAMDSDSLIPAPKVERKRGQIREGFRYVRENSELALVIAVVAVVNTVGFNFPLSLPLMVRETFGLDADAYGLLATTLAVGTFGGAFWAARRSTKSSIKFFLLSGLIFGVLSIGVGFAPGYFVAAAILIPCGFAQLTFATAAMSIVQLSVTPQYRGRVMGIYMLAFLGGLPLGSPLLGMLANIFTARAPLIVGGISCCIAVIIAAFLWRRRTPTESLSLT